MYVHPGSELSSLFTGLVEHSFHGTLALDDPEVTSYIIGLLTDFVRIENLYKVRDMQGRPLEDVIFRASQRQDMLLPLAVTETAGRFNVQAMVKGGGVTGWTGALRLGIARALLAADEGYRRTLRQHGLLTRDARVKERKKPGLKRARKAPQFTKR